ncbi:MAG: FAD:protein FMN transferase [Planctomycetota bacterium]
MLTTITHPAMATEFAVILAEADAHRVEDAVEALEMLDKIEAELTVYNEASEISRVNAAAAEDPVAVCESTFALLERSLKWSRRTAGAFDVTAGPLVRAWGFTQRRGRKPTDAEITQAIERVGYQHVTLFPETREVRFGKPGMEINLGAIGKGDALDRLAQRLQDAGVENFLLHGGASSVLARGRQSPEQDGWLVGISHPLRSNDRLAGLRLHNEALSTSGSGKQFFHFRGKRYGHVIDPRTGYPAGEMLSLTAIASNATDAEACSTAYFVEGIDAIQQVIDEEETLPRMIGTQSLERQNQVRVIPFAEIDWVDAPIE